MEAFPLPSPDMSFYRDRTVLVTGASAGIGAAMARDLGARGARVLLVARRADALAAVARDVTSAGGRADVIAADLAGAAGAAGLAERLAEPVDVLINNAGYGIQGAFLDASVDDAEGQVELNVTALTSLTRRLLPGMVERGRGGVLNVASVAAFMPAPHFAVYAATKAYVRSLSEALHHEVRGTGVAVTCLCPGPVETEFADRAGMNDAFFDGAMSAEAVAKVGLDALARGERTVVPGAANKVQAAAAPLLPRGVLLRVAGAVMKRAG